MEKKPWDEVRRFGNKAISPGRKEILAMDIEN